MSYLRFVILCIIFLIGGGPLVWLILGRRILLCIDRYFLGADSNLPVTPLEIRQTEWTIGPRKWPFARNESQPFEVRMDAQNRLMLICAGRQFPLGPVLQKRMADQTGEQFDFLFEPDPGDVVSLTQSSSRLCWVEPFEFSLMPGETTRWRRHMYDHLRWIKSSGQTLEVLWRHEEWFYKSRGWMDVYNTRLIHLQVGPHPFERAIAEYLKQTKRWGPGEYRLEAAAPQGTNEVIRIVHLRDEAAAQPGAGLSITLYIDRKSGTVTKVLGAQ